MFLLALTPRYGHLASLGDFPEADDVSDLVLLDKELDALGEVVDDLLLAVKHGLKIELQPRHVDAVMLKFLIRHFIMMR